MAKLTGRENETKTRRKAISIRTSDREIVRDSAHAKTARKVREAVHEIAKRGGVVDVFHRVPADQ